MCPGKVDVLFVIFGPETAEIAGSLWPALSVAITLQPMPS